MAPVYLLLEFGHGYYPLVLNAVSLHCFHILPELFDYSLSSFAVTIELLEKGSFKGFI